MKQRSFLYILVILPAVLFIAMPAYTQDNVDSLWSLLRRAGAIQSNSQVWELAGRQEIKETCISGDCNNGYGISISNEGVLGRYQYEGGFINAKHHGVGIIKTLTGLRVGNYDNEKEAGAYILDNNGLMELHHVTARGSKKITEEFGFELAIVQDHQAKAFEKFTPCNCLVRATHIVVEEYQQPYDITDLFHNNNGSNYKTETRRVEYPGLKNNCTNKIYIRAISNHADHYFDRSLVVLPGQTIRKLPFNITYANIKEDIQYLGQYQAVPVPNQQ
ncbi:MAG: hypothetical protein ABIR78_00440 [Ferruginibacter sp.]